MVTALRVCMLVALLMTGLLIGLSSANVQAEATAEQQSVTPSTEEEQLLALINEERARVG